MPVNLSSPASFIFDVNTYQRLGSMQSVDEPAGAFRDAASAHAGITAQTVNCSKLLRKSADALTAAGSFIHKNTVPLVSGFFLAVSATGLVIGSHGVANPQSGPLASYAYYDPVFEKYQNNAAFGLAMGSMLATNISLLSLMAQFCIPPEHQQARVDPVAEIEMQSREPITIGGISDGVRDASQYASQSVSIGTQTDHVAVDIQALSPASADAYQVAVTIRPENPSSSGQSTRRAA